VTDLRNANSQARNAPEARPETRLPLSPTPGWPNWQPGQRVFGTLPAKPI